MNTIDLADELEALIAPTETPDFNDLMSSAAERLRVAAAVPECGTSGTTPLSVPGWYDDLRRIAEQLHPVADWGRPFAPYANGLVSKVVEKVKRLDRELHAMTLRCEAADRTANAAVLSTTQHGDEPVAWRYRYGPTGMWKYVDRSDEVNAGPEYEKQALYLDGRTVAFSARGTLPK